MTTVLPGLPDLDLLGALADELAAEVEAWLASQRRTAHPLVSLTTAELVEQALRQVPAAPAPPAAPAADQVLPGGLWRVLPDRLLALHPGRRAERVDRLWVSVPRHLELTALVLEQWGWGQTGYRIRTATGRRCILGAQYALLALGYGDEDTLTTAGHRIQHVLTARGIATPYPTWNELPNIGREQALALVREAARTRKED